MGVNTENGLRDMPGKKKKPKKIGVRAALARVAAQKLKKAILNTDNNYANMHKQRKYSNPDEFKPKH